MSATTPAVNPGRPELVTTLTEISPDLLTETPHL
jgi:hypothetical protein